MKRQITAFVTCIALALSGVAATPVDAKSKKNNVVPLILGSAALGGVATKFGDELGLARRIWWRRSFHHVLVSKP